MHKKYLYKFGNDPKALKTCKMAHKENRMSTKSVASTNNRASAARRRVTCDLCLRSARAHYVILFTP